MDHAEQLKPKVLFLHQNLPKQTVH